MNKQTKTILLIGIPILLIGGYFIYKAVSKGSKPQTNEDDDDKDDDDKVDDKKQDPKTTPSPTTDENAKNYVVSTKTKGLNVRNKPSTSGKIIASLQKGCTIQAVPSSTSGWLKVTNTNVKQNCNVKIDDNEEWNKSDKYVSSQFLILAN
jgi:hypothetical protein